MLGVYFRSLSTINERVCCLTDAVSDKAMPTFLTNALDACWSKGKDLSDTKVLEQVIADSGMDPKFVLEEIESENSCNSN